ncbi:PSD1 and planctomycete cytochrome C domain-containing protein [Neorhodopirellula lusitana]|uniref:PSD1 and planctomycete cytochrome C domain-containing protein n=1 Tax=Neorhodopirellula lusitana TaxID=445327 RepID=UPI00385069AD
MIHRIPFGCSLTCIAASVFLSTNVSTAADGSSRQEVPAEHAQFFENEVRPLLANKCFECHGVDEQEGDLRLDSLAEVLRGGDSGQALVPGEPDDSLLMQAVRYESLEMPPDEPLSKQEVQTLSRWVEIGAPWPGADPNAPIRKRTLFDEEDRQWWAIQPLTDPEVPKQDTAKKTWSRNSIDQFIAARLSSEGLTPAPPASKLALVRRLYLNVIGLPPTPEQADAFANDTSDDAYERLVDELLASPAYGEHAARQWLDLVRYADSDGYRADGFRSLAWRYRDYVIKSFNADKPYDRFVQEQIAGDEMFPDDLDAQVALGYLRHWVYEWNIRDARTQWNTIIEDLTDTTADVFMGLGLQCAKCHNHKFDPLLQKDYFRLRAYFEAVLPRDATIATPEELANYEAELQTWETKKADIQSKIDEIEVPKKAYLRDVAVNRFPPDLIEIANKPASERTPHDDQLIYLINRQVQWEHDRVNNHIKAEDKDRLVALRRQLKQFESLKPKSLPQAMVVSDVGPIAPPTTIPKRGDTVIEPGVPSILDPNPMPIPQSPSGNTTGRRTALAKWLTSPTNPLASRVIANRIWQSHFGRGLAENPSDLGRLGGPPSHPELLDHLATELIRHDWSLKWLHRQILLSATFRQSTAHPLMTTYQDIDPLNQFYWRRDTSRLSAEQIRDSFLAATGKLQRRTGGSPVNADSPYRSIFVRTMRNSPDQLLGIFDLPQFFTSNSARNTTTTPIQSLMMFNSDRVLGYARTLAERATASTSDVSQQVISAWRYAYGRRPTTDELNASLHFIESQTQHLKSLQKDEAKTAAIETSKLPYRDGQAVRFLLNDPTLRLSVPHDPALNLKDFTIETFFELRTIANNGDVRTMASKWNRSKSSVGWRFGVTGKGSRRKPQTLVLHAYGQMQNGAIGEAAIFSDQHIDMNIPYYASASVTMATEDDPGEVTFYLKDLSNDDAPLMVAKIPHKLMGDINNQVSFTLGGVDGSNSGGFDGLIDDVRLVNRAIKVDEILHTVEREIPDTIGFWKFEIDPGVMRNSASENLDIMAHGDSIVQLSPRQTAFLDFCHALLNSNEFLYVN